MPTLDLPTSFRTQRRRHPLVRLMSGAGLIMGLSVMAWGPIACAEPNAEALTQSAGAEDPQAPDTFQVTFETTEGDFVVEVNREWSPNGVDRFHTLVTNGFFDGCTFFRVVPGFVVQFGLTGDPEINAAYADADIDDDPVVTSNTRGRLVFAMAGPNTRTTQLFINLGDNPRLDGMGFSPFGEVVEGMEVVDSIFPGYGERPNQGRITRQGDEYLEPNFPDLTRIISARVVGAEAEEADEAESAEASASAE